MTRPTLIASLVLCLATVSLRCAADDIRTTTMSGDYATGDAVGANTALRTAVPSGTVRDPPTDNPNGDQVLCDPWQLADCLAMYFEYRHPITGNLHGDCDVTSNTTKTQFLCSPPNVYLGRPFKDVADAFYDLVDRGFFVQVTSYYRNAATNDTNTQDGMMYHAQNFLFGNGIGCAQHIETSQCITAFVANNQTDLLPNTTAWTDVQSKSDAYADPYITLVLRNPNYARQIQ